TLTRHNGNLQTQFRSQFGQRCSRRQHHFVGCKVSSVSLHLFNPLSRLHEFGDMGVFLKIYPRFFQIRDKLSHQFLWAEFSVALIAYTSSYIYFQMRLQLLNTNTIQHVNIQSKIPSPFVNFNIYTSYLSSLIQQHNSIPPQLKIRTGHFGKSSISTTAV